VGQGGPLMPDRDDVDWGEPADDPREEPSDGPEGRPPSEDEVFNRDDLMPREYR
jgi:hypothetical protein